MPLKRQTKSSPTRWTKTLLYKQAVFNHCNFNSQFLLLSLINTATSSTLSHTRLLAQLGHSNRKRTKHHLARFSITLRPQVQFTSTRTQHGLTKGRNGRDLQYQEEKMRLITRFELATKNETELYALLREVFNELVRSEPDTYQRRNALASIENIQKEIASRAFCP